MHVFDITTIRVASELDWYILQFKATINHARPIFNSFLAAWLSQWIVNRTDQGMRKKHQIGTNNISVETQSSKILSSSLEIAIRDLSGFG